ncbi:uracil-DNA glycosylase [Phycicoccus endophyticus]|uniref:Type-5 uracil-DNA glycosylase n=1 Tax=Phycicoccus endophyticus TaxID=1690220 RepID=A0A7G9R2P2_9MICO|nr:uracil-DNA glycosylase [Phycicoccus endophyticus]NHI20333.1 uracil-DNA glycosylase [Phycicoccus endophyticus]QNN49867.1 uracil-DNA glycosylase [Phycicoccus endophyticus]GGL30034.1 uracil-DNA glycosylase [Phycicoccus endophyticus]
MDRLDPHPVTGTPLPSPAPPGAGWPGDPARPGTPVAGTPARVRRLASSAGDLGALQARISVCRACPRLVRWREEVARTGRRAAFADQPYWGRPGPSFGDPQAEALLVGLAPAANGTNRTGRMFTGDSSGDFLWAALYRTGFAARPTSFAAGDGQALTGLRIVAAVRCAPPANRPTPAERATCAPWLQRELELAAPRLRTVLCLGSIGWDGALAAARAVGWGVPRPKPRFGHAAEATLGLPDGRSVRLVGSYHVSPHNTYTKRLTPDMLDEVLLSLRG